MKRTTNKIRVLTISSLDATLAKKERFNAYMGGYGAHKTLKHPNRAFTKQDIRKKINQYQEEI